MNNRFGNQGPITTAILNIIIINVILFLATFILGSTLHINLDKLFGLYFPLNGNFKIWQLITHMFMHADIFHIFLNMLSLWMFGTVLEKVWGAKKFLIFYFVCGFGAAICYLGVEYYNYLQVIKSADFFLHHPTPSTLLAFLNKNSLSIPDDLMNQINFWKANTSNTEVVDSFKQLVLNYKESLASIDSRFAVPMIGASGATYGVLLGYGYLFPNTIIYFQLFIPIKAKYLVFIYAGIELISTWRHVPGDNIAHVAHLGGMLFGFILIFFWNKKNRNTFY